MHMSEKKETGKISRRDYLKITGAAATGLIVSGAMGYVAKPTVTTTVTMTQTVTASATTAAA
jgi:anaerobic selenocysteine-containing dehydrogenase